MRSWTRPVVPRLPGHGAVPRIYDTATRQLVEADPIAVAGLYVCGITPYDATHIGHAATYLAYDTLIRVWLDAGYDVRYVQNTTDVDDPLLERAAATGVDWRALAAEQTELFRRDMECLGVFGGGLPAWSDNHFLRGGCSRTLIRDQRHPRSSSTKPPTLSAHRLGPWPLLGAPARVFADEMLCEAEARLGRPPVELGATLGVRQICAHPGSGRARRR
ncbi:MAG TPA: hypothetical protein VFC12_07800 [Terriglobales bacterium]|nr:hypothetical protein [Terriglobales bacterium]